jgi:hypothetical protein
MCFLRDHYFADEGLDPLDRGLYTLAAYHAGPARVAKLRQKAKSVGLDPNQWFGDVEIIAAHDIGHELDWFGLVELLTSTEGGSINVHSGIGPR